MFELLFVMMSLEATEVRYLRDYVTVSTIFLK